MTQKLELTFRAVVLGIGLSIVMAAANVYLGLKAGMTVSASIPAAVMAMAILSVFRRKGSVLESNLVQTAASAGESLAAGIIFTMPALLILGIWQDFDYLTTTLIAFSGGLLGVLFMIPMRKVFVVDNKELAFPEGLACAEVLQAGEKGNEEGAGIIFRAIGIGGVFKFTGEFLGIIKGSVSAAIALGSRVFYAGCDISPALVAVGYIVELNIAVLIFLGGAGAWFIGIPLMDATQALADAHGNAAEAAEALWNAKIRYVGVGAMVVGGFDSIFKVRKGLVSAIREMRGQFKRGKTVAPETERNLSGETLILSTAICITLILGIYYKVLGNAGQALLAGMAMMILSFFFTAVASYIVGLVGNSNSPVSGMTITAVLATACLMSIMGYGGTPAILATLCVAGVVCCVACTSGDVCNDLKTGSLVGASPRSQQIAQILGVGAAALILAPVLNAINKSSVLKYGGIIGQVPEIPAPQAKLFASIANGFFGSGGLAWNMVAIGAAVGVAILIVDKVLAGNRSAFRLHLMPVAVGVYLPVGLSVPILIGGLIAHWVGRTSTGGEKKENLKRGVLAASGIIAGESLMGVGLAILASMGVLRTQFAGEVFSLLALGGICLIFYGWSFKKC